MVTLLLLFWTLCPKIKKYLGIIQLSSHHNQLIIKLWVHVGGKTVKRRDEHKTFLCFFWYKRSTTGLVSMNRAGLALNEQETWCSYFPSPNPKDYSGKDIYLHIKPLSLTRWSEMRMSLVPLGDSLTDTLFSNRYSLGKKAVRMLLLWLPFDKHSLIHKPGSIYGRM